MCSFGDLPLCEGNACSSMRVRTHVEKKDKSTYHMRIDQRSTSQYEPVFLFFVFAFRMVLISCRRRLFRSQRNNTPDLEISNSMVAFSFAFSSSFASI